MRTNIRLFSVLHIVRIAALAMVMMTVSLANASTVWTGPNFTYVQPSPGAADVLVAGVVSLARGDNMPLYNLAAGETFYNGTTSPTDTTWAFGSIADYQTLTYTNFATIRAGHTGPGGVFGAYIKNKPMVVHIVSQDIYLALEFTAWADFHVSGSGFTYIRSTPAVTPPTPSVTITNPINGATFTAPASITIKASATVSSGTVTNVAFFANGNLLGSVQAAPFNFTASNLSAGSYALTAVATAAGVSGTSAVVSVTATAPPTPTIGITNPVSGAVFAAPANIRILTSATVSSGTVTNVAFFANSAPLGSIQTAPFNLTASNLSAGAYSLTAVATAAGISATSSVVNITTVVPVTISNSPPRITNGTFSFDYTANPGLSYVVMKSSNLVNWVPVVTNIPGSSPVHFTDPFAPGGTLYYRVGRLPNP